MGLWALTQATVQRLAREHWGTRISLDKLNDAGDTGVDPGTQSLVDELRFALNSKAPIQMPGPLQLIAPKNGPAIQIFQNPIGDGGGTIEFINNVFNNITNNVNNVFNNTVSNLTENSTNITNITVIGPPPPGGSGGMTGSIQIVTGVTGSVSVSGCTATLSLSVTMSTLTVTNGLITGTG